MRRSAPGDDGQRADASGRLQPAPCRRIELKGESQPAIVALPVPRPSHARTGPNRKAIDASLPDAVGGFIEWLVDPKHGWTVADNDERVPIQPRHIAVLFRRFVSFGTDTSRVQLHQPAIEARRVSSPARRRQSFHGARVETGAALAAIELADDELSVFATLKRARRSCHRRRAGRGRSRSGCRRTWRSVRTGARAAESRPPT